ncbi:protein LURP-one-related 8-like [Typha angustifolia]|uniref:protein LURP-one-related 8-like n=1 Tax=Typha angustifolia TaxID=59011 RepID=UPI003C2E65D5
MTKVYPNTSSPAREVPNLAVACHGGGGVDRHVSSLTVWRKSLLFNCSGFTVFDAKGNLVFRVDNYGSGRKGEVVLMDTAGKPLLTVRRKKLSLNDHWVIYNGEEDVNPIFSVKRHMNLRQSKTLAHVTPCGGGAGYQIEGSYSQRSCVVYDDRRQRVAEIKRKEAAGGVGFGADVFRLVVQPEIDTSIAMAIVIVVDQVFGAKHSLLRSWSS